MSQRYRIGFDIGGTFTDFVLFDAETGRLRIHKCLTTSKDPATGALAGLDEVVQTAGLNHPDVGLIAPVFGLVGHQPASPTDADTVTVTADLSATISIASVELRWRIVGAFQRVPMFDDGMHGDGAAGDPAARFPDAVPRL